jgi:REP element-mobilizing transposase RayT
LPQFGKCINAEITLSEIGIIARELWISIDSHYEHIGLDEFVIMPNHLHGILTINNRANKDSVIKIITSYKALVSRKIKESNIDTAFSWQRGFYDHIIRNHSSIENIRKYIIDNPMKWHLDKYYIDNH